jgi:hypothetical protein
LLPYSLSLCCFPSWFSVPFRLSLPFILSFICFSVLMFACFFSQLPKQPAKQFRAFVKTNFCCSWYCRTSKVGQVNAQWWSCTHVISMLDLI